MSITDELREWGNRWEDTIALEIKEIADRIDERYHRDMATAQQVGINEGEDAAMREGWVELPKDADGVPIHVGDEVKLEHSGKVTTVTNINYNEYGWQVYCAEGGGFDKDTRSHHVRPDSWERILDDAAKLSRGDNGAVMELVERCRRLAGEDA